jgi:hypothetical protein
LTARTFPPCRLVLRAKAPRDGPKLRRGLFYAGLAPGSFCELLPKGDSALAEHAHTPPVSPVGITFHYLDGGSGRPFLFCRLACFKAATRPFRFEAPRTSGMCHIRDARFGPCPRSLGKVHCDAAKLDRKTGQARAQASRTYHRMGRVSSRSGPSVRHPRTPSVNPPALDRRASAGTARKNRAAAGASAGPSGAGAHPSGPGEDPRQCSTALSCEHKPLGLLLNEPCRLQALDGNPVQPAVEFAFSDKLQCPPLGRAEAQGSRGSCHCRALYPAVLTSALRRHGAAVASTVSRAPSRTREPGRTARLGLAIRASHQRSCLDFGRPLRASYGTVP